MQLYRMSITFQETVSWDFTGSESEIYAMTVSVASFQCRNECDLIG